MRLVSVIGASSPVEREEEIAEELGEMLAREGLVLVCGGGSGVMAAACRGARRAGGLTLGILPTPDRSFANEDVQIAVPTGLGAARNRLVALTGEAVVAVGGRYGTLSEIAFALDAGRPVCSIGGWREVEGVRAVSSAREALEFVLNALGLSHRTSLAGGCV
ncbi:TIGR00725 family protein [Candidatus Fermentibacterales bacterium]|nr:TIGR00725 family protein [Candidatus Fermentibacterales bacterium]